MNTRSIAAEAAAHTTLSTIVDLLRAQDLLVRACSFDEQVADVPVSGADSDSRFAAAGHLFVCKGRAFRTSYLQSALERGAVGYLVDEARADELADAFPDVPALVVSDIRRAMGLVAPVAWGHPDRDLRIFGITGTKGKSTVAYMLRAILDAEAAGRGATAGTAIMGSIDTYDGIENFESVNTTPEACDLWRHVAHAVEAGLPNLVMEVSSQALKYDRVVDLGIDVGCFLNIGRDHISPIEHPDFEDYFAAKLRLFDQARIAVVNTDMEHADEVLARAAGCEEVRTFGVREGEGGAVADADSTQPDATAGPRTGTDVLAAPVGAREGKSDDSAAACAPAATDKPTATDADTLATSTPDVWASDVRSELGRVHFVVHSARGVRAMCVGMPGFFNVDNALAAIAMAELADVPDEAIAEGLAHVRVPGRMELITTPRPEVVALVDYAHNKLSYQRFFSSVAREFAGQQIIAVLGAPGDKAQERRVELPQEASKWADLLIYTEEDPAHERVEDICAEMAAATPAGQAYEVIPDRPAAIARAVEAAFAAPEGALVCLLAKGDETRQHEGDEFVPCETDGAIFEREVARILG